MRFDRFARAMPALAVVVALSGCVTLAPLASPTLLPTNAPTPTAPATAVVTLAPTAPGTAAPTSPPTTAPTSVPTTAPTAPLPPPTVAPTEPPIAGSLSPILDANYPPTLELSAAFTDDPRTKDMRSGGSIDVSYLGGDCRGFATEAPDYKVSYTSGLMSMLRFYFVASGDTTLIINDPDGAWHCSDDTYGTRNPTIDFSPPISGRYDIWIGSFTSGDTVPGTLFITELDSNHP